MYSKTSVVSSRRVGHECRCTSSFLSVAKKLSATALTLLCQGRLLVGVAKVRDEQGKDAAGDVTHQAASDLFGALALGGAPGDVVAGLRVVDHAVVGDQPERAVALA